MIRRYFRLLTDPTQTLLVDFSVCKRHTLLEGFTGVPGARLNVGFDQRRTKRTKLIICGPGSAISAHTTPKIRRCQGST